MSPMTRPSVKARGAPAPARKHFDGWQLGVLAIVIAWGSALLMVPRTAIPDRLPLPRVEPSRRDAILRRDRALAAQAKGRSLDLAVRKLGADLREIGRAESTDGTSPGYLVERTQRDAREAVGQAPDQVLELRAYQTDLFTKAIYAWAATGKESADLIELGGAIRDVLPTLGWVEAEGRGRRVVIDELALRALYKKRWDGLAGFDGPGFALDPDEVRATIAFQLERGAALLDEAASTGQLVADNPETAAMLGRIRELSAIDPSYPSRFAEGIVHFKSADYTASVDAFARYLQASPDGPYAMRARNFMKAALSGALAAGE